MGLGDMSGGFFRRLRMLFQRPRFRSELEEEMAFHRAERQRVLEADGMATKQAQRVAAREFGGVEQAKERSMEVVGFRFENTVHDLGYGLRQLRRNPGFTLLILLTLAIGIGVNTTIFSVTNALLLKPLPYRDADRLAILWLRSPGIGIPEDWPSPGQYHDIRTQNHVFEETAIAFGGALTLTGSSEAVKVDGIAASSSLLPMLGVKPLLGRLFVAEEDLPGRPPTVLLTYGLWQRIFGGDPGIVGRSITLSTKPRIVIGVLPRSFQLNHEVVPTVGGIDKPEVILPLPMDAKESLDYGEENYNILARLKPGVSMEQAQADVKVIAERLRIEKHRDPSFTISVVPLTEQVVGKVKNAVLVLQGAVAMVLLIACTNVANLLLSRATGRQKEMAIRTALGAGRTRLLMQMLTESVLLGLLGGSAGLAIAACALSAVRKMHPGNIPRLDDIGMDFRVMGFTLGLSLITGIVFGLAPGLRALRVDPISTLKASGRSPHGGGLNVRRDKLRGVLVVAELAISLTLLVGAGLLVRSFIQILKIPPGFDPSGVISMRVSANGLQFKEAARRIQFYQNVSERVRSLPGISGEGMTSVLPMTPSVSWGGVEIEGYVPPADQPELQVDRRNASSDYYRTMKIPLTQGRYFSEADRENSPPVAIVDQKMADRFWPHGSAVGKRIRTGDSDAPWLTVVGVVGVVKQYGLDTDTRMVVYVPYAQRSNGTMFVVARTTGDAASAADSIIRQIHGLDPNVPIYDVSTMDHRVRDSLARQRFAMTMLAAFAGFSALLAAIGVYGVLSFLVTQGTPDIAIRMALGARRESILGLVFQQGMLLALAGIAVGLAGAFGLTKLMSGLLFGVTPSDPLTFSVVAGLLAGVAICACYFPARRAMGVDPMVALRTE